jgi:hypothetical protein
MAKNNKLIVRNTEISFISQSNKVTITRLVRIGLEKKNFFPLKQQSKMMIYPFNRIIRNDI